MTLTHTYFLLCPKQGTVAHWLNTHVRDAVSLQVSQYPLDAGREGILGLSNPTRGQYTSPRSG